VPHIEEADRVLVVGLGNPGRRYDQTRHNVGFLVIDEIARQLGITLSSRRFDGLYGDGLLESRRMALLQPQTFMNRSGRSAAQAFRYLGFEPGALVVVHDDVDVEFGRLRLKWAGGNGGHNGLKSIDADLGHKEYFRIRVGIGRPQFGTVTDFVLGRFADGQRQGVERVVEAARDATLQLIRDGLVETQNHVNGRVFWTEGD
jgi:PTH1 family peptidyl-tRNA hydrolase